MKPRLVAVPETVRGIIFSAPMVLQNARGLKRVTRRLLSHQPAVDAGVQSFRLDSYDTRTGCALFGAKDGAGRPVDAFPAGKYCVRDDVACPFGAPGGRLYTKETFQASFYWPEEEGESLRYWTEQPVAFRGPRSAVKLYFAADGAEYNVEHDTDPNEVNLSLVDHHGALTLDGRRWISPMLMPQWAARSWWRLDGVRVERIGDTWTRDEAILEGFGGTFGAAIAGHDRAGFELDAWAAYWQQLHGTNVALAHAAGAASWVWRLEYSPLLPPNEVEQ